MAGKASKRSDIDYVVTKRRRELGHDGSEVPREPRAQPGTPRRHLFKKGQERNPLWAKPGRKPGMAAFGIPVHELAIADPIYKRILRQAFKYRRQRQKEFIEMFQRVSVGVNNLIMSASLALAASRWCQVVGAECRKGSDAMIWTDQAVKLSARAMQLEKMALDLAEKEASIFAKNKDAFTPTWFDNGGLEIAKARVLEARSSETDAVHRDADLRRTDVHKDSEGTHRAREPGKPARTSSHDPGEDSGWLSADGALGANVPVPGGGEPDPEGEEPGSAPVPEGEPEQP